MPFQVASYSCSFTNAKDMNGPTTDEEWRGALGLIHAVLGLPAELHGEGVRHAFLDARLLSDLRSL